MVVLDRGRRASNAGIHPYLHGPADHCGDRQPEGAQAEEGRRVCRFYHRGDTHMTSTKFLVFWTPSPLVHIWIQYTVLNPHNLPYFIRFPPLGVDVIQVSPHTRSAGFTFDSEHLLQVSSRPPHRHRPHRHLLHLRAPLVRRRHRALHQPRQVAHRRVGGECTPSKMLQNFECSKRLTSSGPDGLKRNDLV